MTDATTEPAQRLWRASELPVPKPPQWWGRGFLPKGEICVLVGDEGIGKSLVWVIIAAHMTTGIPFPSFGIPAREPQDVLLIITEDSLGEVLARLNVAGADINRVHFMFEDEDGTGTPMFPEHMPVLMEKCEAENIRPALIVVDAWLDTVDPGLQVRNTQHARQALAPWKTTATQLDSTVLLLTHTNRLETANTRDLLGATVALRQKARMVLFAARAPHDGENSTEQHVWIGPEKSNTTRMANAVRFTINIEQSRPQTDDDPGTVATLINPSDAGASIRQLLVEWRDETRQESRDANPTQQMRCEDFIRTYMGADSVRPVTEIKEAAREAGYGVRAISTALGNLGTSAPSATRGPWLFHLALPNYATEAFPVNTAHIANTAHTAHIGIQSVQTPQSLQTQQGYPSAAHMGGRR